LGEPVCYFLCDLHVVRQPTYSALQ
jgi:hypothetical protein